MVNPSEKGARSELETAVYLLAQRKAVFLMAQHYWAALGKSPVAQDLKVANLASAWAIDAIPFALALEGKSRYDLMMAMKVKPKNLKVDVQNYELDPQFIDTATNNNPFFRLIAPDASTFHQADIRELPIPDASQDIVLLRNPNWKHNFTPEDITKVYGEIDRILKPGGICWSTHVFQRIEVDVSRIKTQERGFTLLIDERNAFPGPRKKFTIPETGEIVDAGFDSFILIAQKRAA